MVDNKQSAELNVYFNISYIISCLFKNNGIMP